MIATFSRGSQVPEIYVDYNASTPIDPRVTAVMRPLFEGPFANPSATHPNGRAAHVLLDQARAQVADLLGCRPDEIVFTSGGSEAGNLAVAGVFFAHRERGAHITTTAIIRKGRTTAASASASRRAIVSTKRRVRGSASRASLSSPERSARIGRSRRSRPARRSVVGRTVAGFWAPNCRTCPDP